MPMTVHVPSALLKSVDQRAKALGLSRHRLIIRALEQVVSARTGWAPEFLNQLRHVDLLVTESVDQLGHRCHVVAPLEASGRAVTYVLDTNAVSALMTGTAAVVERLAAIEPGDVGIPQPVFAEIAFGIERLPRSKRRQALQARFELVCSELQRTEWTDTVSHAYGRIKAALERRGMRIGDATPRSPHMPSQSAPPR
ncbi:MAG: PIN domain-containing protein [Acidobacteriota bacterium]